MKNALPFASVIDNYIRKVEKSRPFGELKHLQNDLPAGRNLRHKQQKIQSVESDVKASSSVASFLHRWNHRCSKCPEHGYPHASEEVRAWEELPRTQVSIDSSTNRKEYTAAQQYGTPIEVTIPKPSFHKYLPGLSELLDLGFDGGWGLTLRSHRHLLLQHVDLILNGADTAPLPPQVACIPRGYEERQHHYRVDECKSSPLQDSIFPTRCVSCILRGQEERCQTRSSGQQGSLEVEVWGCQLR